MKKFACLFSVFFSFSCLLSAQGSKKSRFFYPRDGINQFIIYGQSLSTGQQTPPAISIDNYKGNLMLGEQVWSNFSNGLDNPDLKFNPLIAAPTIGSKKTNQEILADTNINSSSQINCEPPIIGFTNAVKFYSEGYAKDIEKLTFAATSTGEGGKSIELLMKNCPNKGGIFYNHLLKTLEKSKEAASRMNKDIHCAGLLWMQGEYNYTKTENIGWLPNSNATSDKIQYKKYLGEMATNMISDVQRIYQQEKPPVFITYQAGAQYTNNFEISIGMAQLELANEDKRVIMAGPVYPVTDRGGHLCPNGSRWYGEMMAKVYYKTVIKGEEWKPLQPSKITRRKNYIDIDFHVPVKPLKLDTLTLEKVKNYGFEIKNDGQVLKIKSVSIKGSASVRIHLLDELNNGKLEVNYAGPSVKGHGNLCDSDDFQSFEKYVDLKAEGKTVKQQLRFRPNYEPKDKSGQIIYNQPYPLQNFSLAFYYQLASSTHKVKL